MQHGLARPHEGFADQVQRLLAAVRDQQIFVTYFIAFGAQQPDQRLLQRGISVRRAQLENCGAFPLPHGVRALLSSSTGKNSVAGLAMTNEIAPRDMARVIRPRHFLAAIVGEQRFPAEVSIHSDRMDAEMIFGRCFLRE